MRKTSNVEKELTLNELHEAYNLACIVCEQYANIAEAEKYSSKSIFDENIKKYNHYTGIKNNLFTAITEKLDNLNQLPPKP